MASEAGPPQLAGRAYLQLVLLGALIGIPAGLAAALFLALVNQVQTWLWTDLPDALGESAPPWYLVIGLPVAGAVVVIAGRRLLPGDGGHDPLKGLNMDPTPARYLPGIALAALGTLGFGLVLGPEAPVIAIGSAVAIGLTSFARLGERATKVLGTAGSFSAVSSLFGGPIVGGTLLTEGGVGLGAALIPALLPGFVAAAVGYLIFIGFGSWQGLDEPGLVVPHLPAYDADQLGDVPVALAVGFVTAVVIVTVRGVGTKLAEKGRPRLGVSGFLLAGGLAVGLTAQLADVLGADSQDVLFSGQAAIPDLIGETSTAIVLLLIAAKAVGYVVTMASGFRGGPIFPALFLGIGVATLPVVWFDVSPTLAVAVGAAAGMAAQTKLILSSILFSALLVGSNGIDTVSAAVFAAATAWLTVTALEKRAAGTAPASDQVSAAQ